MAEDRRNNALLAGIVVFVILVIGIIALIYFVSRTEIPEGLNQTTENIQVNIQQQTQEQAPGTTEQTGQQQETVAPLENQQPQTQKEQQQGNMTQGPAGNQTTQQQNRQAPSQNTTSNGR
ncbi:MAG: hypothetical protein A2287_08185 [Candidatus Melainabacteria bacterium RIFOXYA12_FULL_32_12]|nr:MAG: hypothetical protein A2104_05980 [Candidatus Melainabacteria bacterium GWF2_32_7]OGI22662.1 MAG: hypothetical protein A2255_01975 [Candidatus Melainabacteria bacterium RIFOXYA2_FULL_32_9]OGI31767.1 MAG: hypothetical protein A2287_08185 [Candidatus Melainabacteria bacterium RIFOXYA12_FULL_32_12]